MSNDLWPQQLTGIDGELAELILAHRPELIERFSCLIAAESLLDPDYVTELAEIGVSTPEVHFLVCNSMKLESWLKRDDGSIVMNYETC